MNKILLINPYPEICGPTVAILRLLNEIKTNWKIYIISVPGEAFEVFRISGFDVIESPVYHIKRKLPTLSLSAMYNIIKSISLVKKVIIENEIDVVYTNSEAYWLGNLLGKYLNRKTIYHIHGLTAIKPVIIGKLVGKILDITSDKILVVAAWMVEEYVSMGISREKIEVVRNGVSLGEYKRIEGCERKQRDKTTIVGMVANIDPRKGHIDFIRAAKLLLKRKNNSYEFLVIGNMNGNDSYYKKMLEELQDNDYGQSIKIIGKRKDMLDVYENIDIIVVPSHIEAGPIVPVEAMACGIPVVATDVGGNRETILSGVTGLIVPVGDIRKIAEAIEIISTDEKKRRTMGIRGRERVEKLFDIKKSGIQLDEILTN